MGTAARSCGQSCRWGDGGPPLERSREWGRVGTAAPCKRRQANPPRRQPPRRDPVQPTPAPTPGPGSADAPAGTRFSRVSATHPQPPEPHPPPDAPPSPARSPRA
ncbi:hypothetical protein C4B68_25005 [Streptomyces dengpaensis]|uniref:Uncharacterized protein n=1 Tax=Streptomyces dengpaensis TaxID=2049881 RepID=A0ABM6SUQ0_9ACTN|nr:hypothetical protein C4B68_25005 [Streptomyces dengpaensis]